MGYVSDGFDTLAAFSEAIFTSDLAAQAFRMLQLRSLTFAFLARTRA